MYIYIYPYVFFFASIPNTTIDALQKTLTIVENYW